MASLFSLPEHLIGVIYSLLPDTKSKLAFRSSSPEVRGAPSIVSTITEFYFYAHKLERKRGMNPLACLPEGVQLQKLTLVNSKDVSIAELLSPGRVQEVLCNLHTLEIRNSYSPPNNKDFLAQPRVVGTCIQKLPLRNLELWGLNPGDVCTLLATISEGQVAQSLEDIKLNVYSASAEDHNAIIAALVPFANLKGMRLVCDATDYAPLLMLPALKELFVPRPSRPILDVLPQLPQLESLRMYDLPSSSDPPLRSATLKSITISQLNLGGLTRIVALACEGAMPRLQVLEATYMMAGSTMNAHESGTALAAMLHSLPHLEVRIRVVDGVEDIDAFLDLCMLVPQLWRGTGILSVCYATPRPPSRIDELLRLFPELNEVIVKGCYPEEVQELCDVLGSLQSLESIELTMSQGSLSASMAASIQALCAEGASVLAREGQVLEVLLVVWLNEGSEEEQTEALREELDMLQRSWDRIKTALGRSGPCKVNLDVECDAAV